MASLSLLAPPKLADGRHEHSTLVLYIVGSLHGSALLFSANEGEPNR